MIYKSTDNPIQRANTERATKAALQYIADALVGMVADTARFNDDPGKTQYTELAMSGEDAALALAAIQRLLKPLPEGTMTI